MASVPSAPVTRVPAVDGEKFLTTAETAELATEPTASPVCPRRSRIVLAPSVMRAFGRLAEAPTIRLPALTLMAARLVLTTLNCRAPSPALTSVVPPEMFALIARPACSLASPRVPDSVVPATLSTVTVVELASAKLPCNSAIARTSSTDVAVMPPVSVSVPAPVQNLGPPSL